MLISVPGVELFKIKIKAPNSEVNFNEGDGTQGAVTVLCTTRFKCSFTALGKSPKSWQLLLYFWMLFNYFGVKFLISCRVQNLGKTPRGQLICKPQTLVLISEFETNLSLKICSSHFTYQNFPPITGHLLRVQVKKK
jgi:hypothetical protein